MTSQRSKLAPEKSESEERVEYKEAKQIQKNKIESSDL